MYMATMQARCTGCGDEPITQVTETLSEAGRITGSNPDAIKAIQADGTTRQLNDDEQTQLAAIGPHCSQMGRSILLRRTRRTLRIPRTR